MTLLVVVDTGHLSIAAWVDVRLCRVSPGVPKQADYSSYLILSDVAELNKAKLEKVWVPPMALPFKTKPTRHIFFGVCGSGFYCGKGMWLRIVA